MFEWFSFGRGVHGELGRKVVTGGVDAPGLQNTDVRAVVLPTNSAEAPPELVSVSCGHFHSLAITSEGQVLAWGTNGESQLGISGEVGEDIFVSAPARSLHSLQETLVGER